MARQLEDSPLDAIVEQLGRWDVASARLVALLARSGGRHALGAALDHHEGLQRIRRQVMAMCHHPGRLGSGAPQARHARLAALAAHGEAFHWECAAIESLLDRSRQAGEQTAVERQQDGAMAISRLVSMVALRVEEAGTADLAAAWARLRQELWRRSVEPLVPLATPEAGLAMPRNVRQSDGKAMCSPVRDPAHHLWRAPELALGCAPGAPASARSRSTLSRRRSGPSWLA